MIADLAAGKPLVVEVHVPLWHRDTFQTQWKNHLHAEQHAAFLSFEITEAVASIGYPSSCSVTTFRHSGFPETSAATVTRDR